MGFLDDLGKRVVDAGQKTVQKTKEMSDVAHMNSLITQEVNKMNSMYCQIGKLYMTIHGNDCEEEFLEMVNAVAALEQKVREYRKQIQDIKGIQCCEKCGAEVPRGIAFCSSCGNPLPKAETQMNTAGYTKCPNCGNAVENGVRFCTFCGSPIVQSMGLNAEPQNSDIPETEMPSGIAEKKCPNCGAKLEDGFAFCTECGTKL